MAAGDAYASAALADLPTLRGLGDSDWAPVRHLLGIASFGVNAFTTTDPGDIVIDEHDEADSLHEELYLVLSGRAEFAVDGARIEAPAGTLVLVRDPAVGRGAKALDAATSVLAVGGVPGGAYEPMEWERSRTAELGQ